MTKIQRWATVGKKKHEFQLFPATGDMLSFETKEASQMEMAVQGAMMAVMAATYSSQAFCRCLWCVGFSLRDCV